MSLILSLTKNSHKENMPLFTSRYITGTLPLTIETQTKKLSIPDGIANFAASFGTTIGHNGCFGVFPAMLAVMFVSVAGKNPINII